MYRRVFGNDSADASRLRWEWQYRHNPNNPGGTPVIWIAREGPTLVGQYATMPVRLQVHGTEVDASWGMDVMVAPERQRQGIGEVLFRTWDRHVGASLGLGLSESSHRLFRKLRWPERRADSVPGQAPHAPCPQATELARAGQPARLVDHPAFCEDHRALAPAASRDGDRPTLRAGVHVALGEAGSQVRVRRASRRGLPELEVCGSAPRALRRRRVAARHGSAGLRRLPAPAGATGPCHDPGRFPHGPRRRGGDEDVAALGGPRGAGG